MGKSISDAAAAIASASRLYSAIGSGLSLQKAYKQACVSLMFDSPDEADAPALFVADGVNPDELYFVEVQV